jgi:hypothetical protein
MHDCLLACCVPCGLLEIDRWAYENAVHDFPLVLTQIFKFLCSYNSDFQQDCHTDLKDVFSFFFKIIWYPRAMLNILFGYVA